MREAGPPARCPRASRTVRVRANGSPARSASSAIAVRSWHSSVAAAEFTTGAPRRSRYRASAERARRPGLQQVDIGERCRRGFGDRTAIVQGLRVDRHPPGAAASAAPVVAASSGWPGSAVISPTLTAAHRLRGGSAPGPPVAPPERPGAARAGQGNQRRRGRSPPAARQLQDRPRHPGRRVRHLTEAGEVVHVDDHRAVRAQQHVHPVQVESVDRPHLGGDRGHLGADSGTRRSRTAGRGAAASPARSRTTRRPRSTP